MAMLLLGACSTERFDGIHQNETEAHTFTAGFENLDTKTSVDEDLHLYWTADDRISIFTTTFNDQYRFTGNTGDNSGGFEKISAGGFVTGSSISKNYAVYPYSSGNSISYDEKLTLSLPATQVYEENSFGLGANTMVAVTASPNDFFLSFKNLCGYLVLKLYGNETIKSITFEGNNGEKIAGKATVTATYGSTPSVVMSNDATTSITIDCGEGITLGSTKETATAFWFCIPPTTFSKGFTFTVTDVNGGTMTKSVSSSKTISRNVKMSMAALKADCASMELLAISFNSGTGYIADPQSGYLWGSSSDAITNDASVLLQYNGGAVDVSELLSIVVSENGVKKSYSWEDFKTIAPDYRLYFTLYPYVVGQNVTSEDMYGQISGTEFTPCYTIFSDGRIYSCKISKGSTEGLSAVGRMPVVEVTITDASYTKFVSGYFKIEIIQ